MTSLASLIAPVPKSLCDEEYSRYIHFDRIVSDARMHQASVVIATYRAGDSLLSCLGSLETQSVRFLQVIVVDNGNSPDLIDRILEKNVDYVCLRENFGPSMARNVGALYVKSPFICFVDDDGFADSRMVEMHLKAYRNTDVIACRGRCVPNKENVFLGLSVCDTFDYGDEVRPAPLNIEGNMSISRSVFEQVHGFDPRFFGFEGRELTTRLLAQGFRKDQILYVPEAVLYHDVKPSVTTQLRKEIRHVKALIMANQIHGKVVGLSEYSLRSKDYLKRSPWFIRLFGWILRQVFQAASRCAACYFQWKWHVPSN